MTPQITVKCLNSNSSHSINSSITSSGSNVAINRKQTNNQNEQRNSSSDYSQNEFVSSESSSGK